MFSYFRTAWRKRLSCGGGRRFARNGSRRHSRRHSAAKRTYRLFRKRSLHFLHRVWREKRLHCGVANRAEYSYKSLVERRTDCRAQRKRNLLPWEHTQTERETERGCKSTRIYGCEKQRRYEIFVRILARRRVLRSSHVRYRKFRDCCREYRKEEKGLVRLIKLCK